ncbi:MAG: hypothetical protein ACJAUV_001667 [Flavobacteriales bacterium]|jgi:hypothetical protein
MESTSILRLNDILNLDRILSLIIAKGKINKSMVKNHLSLDRLESDFIFNTFCKYADNLDILKAEFYGDDSASIVRINKPVLDRFIKDGGFNEYFKEKEETPTVKQKNAPASSKTVTKSNKDTWYTNPWLIGVTLALLAAIFNTKRIMSLFNNVIDSF